MCLDIHPTYYSVKAYRLSAVFKNMRPPKGGFVFMGQISYLTKFWTYLYLN